MGASYGKRPRVVFEDVAVATKTSNKSDVGRQSMAKFRLLEAILGRFSSKIFNTRQIFDLDFQTGLRNRQIRQFCRLT